MFKSYNVVCILLATTTAIDEALHDYQGKFGMDLDTKELSKATNIMTALLVDCMSNRSGVAGVCLYSGVYVGSYTLSLVSISELHDEDIIKNVKGHDKNI